jgi:hypothetical protein
LPVMKMQTHESGSPIDEAACAAHSIAGCDGAGAGDGPPTLLLLCYTRVRLKSDGRPGWHTAPEGNAKTY